MQCSALLLSVFPFANFLRARCCYQRCGQTWNGCRCFARPQHSGKKVGAAIGDAMFTALAVCAAAPVIRAGFSHAHVQASPACEVYRGKMHQYMSACRVCTHGEAHVPHVLRATLAREGAGSVCGARGGARPERQPHQALGCAHAVRLRFGCASQSLACSDMVPYQFFF